MSLRPVPLFPPLLASTLVVLLLLWPAVPDGPRGWAFAEEEGGGDVEPGDDLGDQDVPFADRVNKAIDMGVAWLRARPRFFEIPGTEGVQGAHYGLIHGAEKYDPNAEGDEYRHPAGPTALALYTLLKCGVDPDDHLIEKGFAWLREVHQITDDAETDMYDAFNTGGRDRSWNHTIAGSSYELSVMILALTAKYDHYKKSSASRHAEKLGKLKIKDRYDRSWLQQLVNALVARRGQPSSGAIQVTPTDMKKLGDPLKYDDMELPEPPDQPPREDRLGWRYNAPRLNLYVGGRNGGEGLTRGGNIPPFGNQDMSSTQLATLALFSALRFRIPVDPQVWFDVVEFTLAQQEEQGPEHKRHMPGYVPDRYGSGKPPVDHARGFMYIKGSTRHSEGKATGSMTACGLCNLLLAKAAIHQEENDKRYAKARDRWQETGLREKVDTAIMDAMAWLDRNWSPFDNRYGVGYHIYYLYCLERAMDIQGKQLVGEHLWYHEGALQILSRTRRDPVRIPRKNGQEQDASGAHWNTEATHDPKDVLDTCFALLFLKRATQGLVPGPVVTGGGGPGDGR